MDEYIKRSDVLELAREYYTPALREEAVPVRAIKNIPAAVTIPKWIPVTDKLPQKCQFCLVTDFGIVEEAYYNSDCVWVSRYDDKLKDVTHWMPLPKAPKEETDG